MPRIQSFPTIGYWCSESEPELPDPKDFVDGEWDPKERTKVIAYLDRAYSTDYLCMGFSTCRFCGQANGSDELTDGTFIFPEGFAHYLREHFVRPPEAFLQHIRDLDYTIPDLKDFEVSP